MTQACRCCCIPHFAHFGEDAAKRGGHGGQHLIVMESNIVDHHGKSWKNHVIVFLNFCGTPEIMIVHSAHSSVT